MNKKRRFLVGDEWLYYKIYCGSKTADTVLTEIIKPITEKMLEERIIDKWFFIRYADPQTHLRVRFHLFDNVTFEKVVALLNEYIEEYVESNMVWKISIESYERELERYGENLIELTEELFYNDSVLTSNIISSIDGPDKERIRWGVGLLSVDEFINDFGLNQDEKFSLITYMKDTFEQEFNLDKGLKKQLGNKYRRESSFIYDIMERNVKLDSFYQIIAERSDKNKEVVKNILKINKQEVLSDEFRGLMWSYLHMLNNRLFKSKQRMHELVMYYYLFQYHKSKLARMGRKFR